jgi:RNA polymerase sigma-70 factor (family 1)
MADYKSFSDHQLIELLKQRDHAAFTEIYNRYHYLMIAFAYKKLRDEDLAKDFVQELFTTLWQKKDNLKQPGTLSSYLYISLRSRILDYFGHQNVAAKYLESLKDYSVSGIINDTDHKIRERQLQTYIDQQIQNLPKKMRIVFEMSRKDQLSYKLISEKLSISERTVQTQITNTLSRLKAKLSLWLF